MGEMLELSWKPRSTFLKGFLTPEECETLIALVRPLSCTHFESPHRCWHAGPIALIISGMCCTHAALTSGFGSLT